MLTGGVVVAVGACGMLADAAVAARAEAHVASAVARESNLEMEPRVSIGGSPYLASTLTGEISGMSVEVLDVDTPGFGLVNASTQLDGLKVTADQVLTGEISGARAELSTRRISLDEVAVGEQLGMTDLDISNPYDISPTGGGATEVQLTGTPEGFSDPVTVLATLRLDGEHFTMRPYEVLEAPEGREEEAAAAFAWDLDTRVLPLESRVESVGVSGGSLRFEAQRRNITVSLSDLAPIESSEASDFDSTDYGAGR